MQPKNVDFTGLQSTLTHRPVSSMEQTSLFPTHLQLEEKQSDYSLPVVANIMKVRAGMKAQTGESQGKYEPSQTHRTRGKAKVLNKRVKFTDFPWKGKKNIYIYVPQSKAENIISAHKEKKSQDIETMSLGKMKHL